MRVGRRVVAVIAVAALGLALAWHGEARAARELRERYRFGSGIGYDLIFEDVARWWEGQPGHDARQTSTADSPISDHDLFMLVEATQFQVGRSDELSAAAAAGRLPVRYAFLDGYDTNAIVLRRSLRDALSQMPAAGPDAVGAQPDRGALSMWTKWQVAPVLLCSASSPSVRDAAARAIADEPLLSVHTCGQVLSTDVLTWGVRYTLGCIREEPSARKREVAALQARVEEVAGTAEATAAITGSDDAAYVRAAFNLLAQRASYAEQGSSPHDNDAYGALVENSARCYGLAGALKLVLDARGIPNYLANGTKGDGRHTVNVVWADGSWRVCDLTLMLDADDGAGHVGEGSHEGVYACLELERNYCIAHGFVPDQDARTLELVYSQAVHALSALGDAKSP